MCGFMVFIDQLAHNWLCDNGHVTTFRSTQWWAA